MLSKAQLTYLRSLHQKKFRQMYGKFLVEGHKSVTELIASQFKIEAIFKIKGHSIEAGGRTIQVFDVSEEELRKIATVEAPDEVVAVAEIPPQPINTQKLEPGLYLACDSLNDPGNAGTIIRIADWFGIKQLFFSEHSVDAYNPKVVNAAKGSLFRVQPIYIDLRQLFEANQHLPVYGAFMDGRNIYHSELKDSAIIVMGNEATGINEELRGFITEKIAIPTFGKAESLNVAVAAGIITSEFMRRGEGTSDKKNL
jgi:TrmH family RNA methyltransferase